MNYDVYFQTMADRIEARWKELLNSEVQQVLINSTQQSAAIVPQHAQLPTKDASHDIQKLSKDAETNTNTPDWHNSWLRTARDPANRWCTSRQLRDSLSLSLNFRLAQKIIENAVDLIIEDIDDACDQIVENIFAEEVGQ